MKTYQNSFFDESRRLAALSRLRDPLDELAKHIDFEMFRPILTDALRKAERKSPAGHKPLDVILMFNTLIIQRLFNLSHEQLEYQITDRPSFTRFLGLYIGETFPDYTSFWGFREALVEKGLERQLFNQFSAKLEPREFLPQAARSSTPRSLKFPSKAIAARKMHESKPDMFLWSGTIRKALKRIPMRAG